VTFVNNDKQINSKATTPIKDTINIIVLVFTAHTPTPPSFFYIFIRLIGVINKDTMAAQEEWRLKLRAVFKNL
jgi:hypothetical protein